MYVNLALIFGNQTGPDSFVLFRTMEDWCHEHWPQDQWFWDYTSTVEQCGIDMPGRIYIKQQRFLRQFTERFLHEHCTITHVSGQ